MAEIEYLTVSHLNTKDLIRFFSKVVILPELHFNNVPCWIWTSVRSKREGYGSFGLPTHKAAHRIMYAWLVHPLPKGKKYGEIDHLCKRPSCCNPVHLEFVNNWTNMIRSNNVGARNLRKTHCPQGHAYSLTNTYVNTKGSRACRMCHNIKTRLRFETDPDKMRRYKREWARNHSQTKSP